MKYHTAFITGVCILTAAIARGELPKTIATMDGQIYRGVSLIRVEPDGFLVNYQPVPNGMGVAKIKFSRLSANLQRAGEYNASEAHDFELAVASANEDYARTLNEWGAAARALKEANVRFQEESAARQKMINAGTYMAQAAPAPAVASYYTGVAGGGGLVLVPIARLATEANTGSTGIKPFTQPFQAPSRKFGNGR